MTPRKTHEPSRADIRAALRILARGAATVPSIRADVLKVLKRRGYADVTTDGVVFLLPGAIHVLVPDGSLDEHARAWADARKAHVEAEARMKETERAFYAMVGVTERLAYDAAITALNALSRYLAEHPDV